MNLGGNYFNPLRQCDMQALMNDGLTVLKEKPYRFVQGLQILDF